MNKSMLALLLIFSTPALAMDDGGKKADNDAATEKSKIARILQGDPNVPAGVRVLGGVGGAALAYAVACGSETADTLAKILLSMAGAVGGKYAAEEAWRRFDENQSSDSNDQD